jgi:NAD(P)H-flavin reductase
MQSFTLIEKKQLTRDVFELIFQWENEINMKSGQFITFILDGIWWRAYSVLESNWKTVSFIIKKRETDNGWRGWSAYICDLEIWDIIKWVWPAGHFVLGENNKNKLFIGTWTWLVPLYNQILWSIKQKQNCNLSLVFWVRTVEDLFYIEEFEKIKKEYPSFDFTILLSQEESELYKKWYVTDFISPENIKLFEEYYICWAPAMIDSTVEKLKKLWVDEENIFLERY